MRDAGTGTDVAHDLDRLHRQRPPIPRRDIAHRLDVSRGRGPGDEKRGRDTCDRRRHSLAESHLPTSCSAIARCDRPRTPSRGPVASHLHTGYNRLTASSLTIGVLGPLLVERGGEPVALGPKQRMLLAILLVHGGEYLSTDRIVEELYDRGQPEDAPGTLHVHVSRLRKALGGEVVQTLAGGTVLGLDDIEVDSVRFGALADVGRAKLAAGDVEVAAANLHEALGLWRGPPLAEFAYAEFAQAEIARLEERRLTALEIESTPISRSAGTPLSSANSRGWCASIPCVSACALS